MICLSHPEVIIVSFLSSFKQIGPLFYNGQFLSPAVFTSQFSGPFPAYPTLPSPPSVWVNRTCHGPIGGHFHRPFP